MNQEIGLFAGQERLTRREVVHDYAMSNRFFTEHPICFGPTPDHTHHLQSQRILLVQRQKASH